MRIKAICIDDANRPPEIPSSKWVKKGAYYHICHIYVMQMQGQIKGCDLSEIDISGFAPYNCFRISRFAFRAEDLKDLAALIKACDDQNYLDESAIEEYVNDLEKTE
jgi:hypothetical protein